MIEKYIFPLPPTLNEIIGTARSNIYASAKEKKIWTNQIAVKCFGRKNFPDKVWVEFVWKIKNFRRDPDNISAAAKFVMDGLVEGGIIRDDSLKYIMSPVLHWYEKGNDLVEIRIADRPIWNGKYFNQNNINNMTKTITEIEDNIIIPEIVQENLPENTLKKIEIEELPIDANLKELVKVIKYEHEKCKANPITSIIHGRNAGEWLIEAKSLVKTSPWQYWVENECKISEKMAETYINIATNWVRLDKLSDTNLVK